MSIYFVVVLSRVNRMAKRGENFYGEIPLLNRLVFKNEELPCSAMLSDDHNPQEYQDRCDTHCAAAHTEVGEKPVWWDTPSQLTHEVSQFASKAMRVELSDPLRGGRRTNPCRGFFHAAERI